MAIAPGPRVLSIQQPWAWAIARGAKKVENRRWSTLYRGPIYISSVGIASLLPGYVNPFRVESNHAGFLSRSWRFALPTRTTSTLVQSLKLTLQRIELVIVELFELNELWSCSGSGSDELIELQLQRSRVTVVTRVSEC